MADARCNESCARVSQGTPVVEAACGSAVASELRPATLSADDACEKMKAVMAALQAIQAKKSGGFCGGAPTPEAEVDVQQPQGKRARRRSPSSSSSSSDSDDCKITGGVVARVVPVRRQRPTGAISLDADAESVVIDADSGDPERALAAEEVSPMPGARVVSSEHTREEGCSGIATISVVTEPISSATLASSQKVTKFTFV
eukprot:TRINITY_DN65989_c0_g1_i1.p1 TRINITY_DN65989_c0_g1~~TRINITY_DN65989_c0_g1_i1.p1  ORF type:complete len:230 (-),score=55.13 TRINITY_DN65989_c0_g1_i1:162-764(-)